MEEVFPSKSLPPAEELQPAPAVPGAVGAEEDLGGAGEWWECYRVPAHIHGQPSSFFSKLKPIRKYKKS